MENYKVTEENFLYSIDKVLDLCMRKNIKHMDGFMPIIDDMYDDDDDFVFFTDAKPTDLSSNGSVSIYMPPKNYGTKSQQTGQLLYLKKLSAKEFRKKTGQFCINPYEFKVTFQDDIAPNDMMQSSYLQFVGGKFKYFEVPNFETTSKMKHEILDWANGLVACQFTLENSIRIYLRPEDAEIGFTYPIQDSSQLKTLFTLRDIPDGKKRRVALKHIVSEHLRRKPTKPDEFSKVKEHWRGRKDFDWFGITGHIIIP